MLQAIVAFLCACFEPEEEDKNDVANFNEVVPHVLEMEPVVREKAEEVCKQSSVGESLDELEDCRERVSSDASFLSIPTEISNSRDLIAQGGFGVLVKVVEGGVEFALKSETIENYDCVANEGEILTSLDHPNIIRLAGSYFDDDFVYLKFPLRETTLDELVAEEKQVKIIFLQVIDAVKYMHSVEIMHRDIKPENILLDENHKPEIIDFGTARRMRGEERAFTYAGTPDYMAQKLSQRLAIPRQLIATP